MGLKLGVVQFVCSMKIVIVGIDEEEMEVMVVGLFHIELMEPLPYSSASFLASCSSSSLYHCLSCPVTEQL